MKSPKMLWIAACVALLSTANADAAETPTDVVIVAVGEPGEPQYEKLFTAWAADWRAAAEKSGSTYLEIGLSDREKKAKADREILRESLARLEKSPPQTLWIVLIGHGTFDGKKAKFNLRGADITASELAERLAPIDCRIAIVNCASASGPFVQQLAAPNRAVVTSTQSGYEYNFARFGGYLAQAIGDASGDLDKDGQTSLLEAWLAAAKRTQEYYESDSRLATEHSLLDDNGDGKGTPADWFRGLHLIKKSKDATLPDGTLANQFVLSPAGEAITLTAEQRQQRDELERKLAELRQNKENLSEEEHLAQLQAILVPIAKLYQAAESPSGEQ
ncbi:hypothetical protein [Blastopirellula retiformator]|uniref:Caspase domain protein n=1 Tax=Blastopirellula retiformator TaxID=2527970 RepID=A0A5C5V8U7_9BACT|nr:hypothetical protein [Blastopirellula retiformator]TWT34393.1 hypothetical protein Enr8_18010 [Blastopirellula retiformator]